MLVIFVLLFQRSLSKRHTACEFYLAPSRNPHMGRAVIAGKQFDAGERIIDMPTLVVPHDAVHESQIGNYVYTAYKNSGGVLPGHSQIVFGLAMLYNHANMGNETVHHRHISSDYDILTKQNIESRTLTDLDSFEFKFSAGVGEEIFGTYGDPVWFTGRGIVLRDSDTVQHAEPYSIEELEEVAVLRQTHYHYHQQHC